MNTQNDIELTEAELGMIMTLRQLPEKEQKFIAGTVTFLMECQEERIEID